MTQRIPIKWLRVQASNIPVTDMLTTSFFRSILAGENPGETDYYKHLKATVGARQALGKVLTLAAHDSDPLEGFCPPVYLRHDGCYELRDGHHRVGAAVARGVTEIECEVQGVDSLWTAITSLLPKRLYQPIDHPWFADREVIWPSKIPQIAEHIQSLREQGRIGLEGNALDIGCYAGGMTRALRNMGYATYAIDNDTRMLQVAGYLDLVFGTGAVYTQRDLRLEIPLCALWPREVTTILSVFHHFLGTHGDVEVIRRTLQVCANYSRATIIDIPLTDEGWQARLPELQTPEQIRALYLAPFKAHTVCEIGEIQGRLFLSVVKKRP